MLSSEKFDVKRTIDDDWFDPILDTDMPLFGGVLLSGGAVGLRDLG